LGSFLPGPRAGSATIPIAIGIEIAQKIQPTPGLAAESPVLGWTTPMALTLVTWVLAQEIRALAAVSKNGLSPACRFFNGLLAQIHAELFGNAVDRA
jgi:hypothetical protein